MRKITLSNITFWVGTTLAVFTLGALLLGYRGVIVVGQSMAPTLTNKSIQLTSLVDEDYAPQHDDIICFFPFGEFNDDTLFVKRIIGVEGDVLQAQEGVLMRNGSIVCSHPGIGTWSAEVPTGTVFVLGDHYYRSTDSRILGAIPLENIYSKICTK